LIQRRAIIGVVLAVAIPVLSGCGLEVQEETSHETSPIQGTNASVGSIGVRNAFVTYDAPTGIQPLASTPPGVPGSGNTGTGFLVVTLVNNGSKRDVLTGVSSQLGAITVHGVDQNAGSNPTQPVTSSSPVTLLPGIPVTFGTPALGGDNGSTLQIATGAKSGTSGTEIKVQFTFTNAGTATVQVPVVVAGNVTVDPTQTVPVPTTTETVPGEGLQPAPD
jgi:copper(I)-binding protein